MLFNFSYVRHAQAFNWAQTFLEVIQSCGDNIKDASEECDGTDFGSTTCATLTDANGNHYNKGKIACTLPSLTDPNYGCKLDKTDCSLCNNGVMEGVEKCDTADFGSILSVCNGAPYYYTGTSSAHCYCMLAGYPLEPGAAKCTSNCLIDIGIGTNCLKSTTTEIGIVGSQGGGSGGGGGLGSGGGGGGGGGGFAPNFVPGSDTPPKDTKLIISGKASPLAVLRILKDGVLWTTVTADNNADYKFETDNDKFKVTPGVLTVSISATDSKGQTSASFSTTFRVASGAVTTISGANIAPTINLSKASIIRGDKMQVFGQTVPVGMISVSFFGKKELLDSTYASSKGDWLLDYDTNKLENDTTYLVKAMFEAFTGSTSARSGYSKSLSLQVGKGSSISTLACPGADLNHDKKVNLIDFSILLFNWGTNNTCADQSGNGKVDLTDFSIMLFNWTG
ncbi:MAG: hypothetical protein WCG01_04095 [bacterium]